MHKLAQTNSSTKKRQRPDEEVGANSKGKSKTARQTGKGSGNPYAAHAQAQAHASSTTSTPASDETKRFGVVFFDDSDLSPNPKKQQQHAPFIGIDFITWVQGGIEEMPEPSSFTKGLSRYITEK